MKMSMVKTMLRTVTMVLFRAVGIQGQETWYALLQPSVDYIRVCFSTGMGDHGMNCSLKKCIAVGWNNFCQNDVWTCVTQPTQPPVLSRIFTFWSIIDHLKEKHFLFKMTDG